MTGRAPRHTTARGEAAIPRYGTVVFDCDSTLSAIEGVDELARGDATRRDAVARLTEAAMRGRVPLERVYAERLALVRPSRADLEAVGRRYVEALVPDAREVVAALRAAGVRVRVISGGLLPAVRALAAALGIPDGDVAAVAVYFTDAGEYAGFDAASPLSRSGGKREVLARWRGEVPHPVMLVGDGATDLEGRAAADCFVAFAGVVERPAVIAGADVVVRARSLAPILPLALDFEPPAAAAARATFEKGVQLLEDRSASREAREAKT